MDASAILLSVPCSERVPPLTLRLITRWRRLRSAGLLSAGTSGSATEDEEFLEEFLDVALDAPAQLALDSRRVRQERAADGQQLPLPGQLGNTPLPWLVMVAGFGCDIELVDCRGPSGQCGVFGVAGSLVVDVPQQVGPAPLLRAIIMVVGSVEIADQYSGESIAQRLVHDCFAPSPPQEVAFGGGAESPHVAVGPALTPAGFVGVDHRAGAGCGPGSRATGRLGPLRRAMDGAHDGPHAEAQLMHGFQIPLDAADGQPPLFPQRGDQAEQVDAEALLAQSHAVPVPPEVCSAVGTPGKSEQCRCAR